MSDVSSAVAAALVSGAIALVGVLVSRRTGKEANRTESELAQFQMLSGTVAALQREVQRLEGQLDDANDKAERLHRELGAAQRNVRILALHIHQYIPEVPFPTLERMNDRG